MRWAFDPLALRLSLLLIACIIATALIYRKADKDHDPQEQSAFTVPPTYIYVSNHQIPESGN